MRSSCADRTHGDTGATEIVDDVRSNELRANLAQGPALGIQLCRTLNVHSATLNELRQSSALSSKPMAYDAIRGLLGEPARPSVRKFIGDWVLEASDDGARPIALSLSDGGGTGHIAGHRGGCLGAKSRRCGGGARWRS